MGGFSTSHVRLRYKGTVLNAGQTVQLNSDSIGGFLCTTSGTIQVGSYDDAGVLTYYPTITVSAGTWLDIPFYLGKNGGVVVSTNAVGVIGV